MPKEKETACDGRLLKEVKVKPALEREAAVELDRPAPYRCARYDSRLAVADSIVARLSKAGMVEDIRRIATKLELDSVLRPEIESLAEREAYISQSRTIYRVSEEVSVSCRSRNRKSGQVIPLVEARFSAAR